jgi:hypothetical protein
MFSMLLTLAALGGLSVRGQAQELDSDCFLSPSRQFSECGSGCWVRDNCGEPQLQWKFDIPAWLPEMHGDVTVRGRSAPVNVTTPDVFKLVDDIDMAAAGRLEVDYDRWGAFADGIYYNLGINEQVSERINVGFGFEQAIVDFAATYDIAPDVGLPNPWEAELLIGGRYNLLEVDRITVTGPRGNSVTASGKRDWVDPIIGGRMRAPVRPDLDLSFRGDVGGFGIGSASQFTWNIEALAEFKCSESCRLSLGYRLLDIDQRQGSGNDRFVYDMQIRGPIARIGFEY